MRLEFLLVRRVPDRPSPLLVEVAELLRARGHQVGGGIIEDRLWPVQGAHVDPETLYLLKSHTEAALSLAGALHDQGARICNPYPACVAAQDKVAATQRLAAAGVPVPQTWLTGDPGTAADLLEDGPIICKPIRGHRGAGVHLVRTPAELAALPPVSGPLVVQRHVPGPGVDLKVYVVADRVWAVRKPFDAASFTRPGVPVPVSAEVRELAATTAACTGLDLFGVDVIESPDGPVVVDLNYFPGYKGCVGVAEPMADYLHQVATGARSLPRLPEMAVASRTREPA